VALNSAGFNVARAVGPALGGVVWQRWGSGTTFLLNAASFFGVILFLYRWQRRRRLRPLRAAWSAIGDGFAYVRESSLAKSVLLRTGTFSVRLPHAGADADHRSALRSARIRRVAGLLRLGALLGRPLCLGCARSCRWMAGGGAI